MASIVEALIAACYFHHGYAPTAAAVVEAFEPEIDLASETLLDFKSALQEHLARSGATVSYEVTEEAGPPHDRRFAVEARVDGEVVGAGSGRSKKAAEQAAANEALARLNAG
jgi:ribonuclease-3